MMATAIGVTMELIAVTTAITVVALGLWRGPSGAGAGWLPRSGSSAGYRRHCSPLVFFSELPLGAKDGTRRLPGAVRVERRVSSWPCPARVHKVNNDGKLSVWM